MTVSRRRLLTGIGTIALAGTGLIAAGLRAAAEVVKLAYHDTQRGSGGGRAAAPEPQQTVDTDELYKPGPLGDMTLGAENAPVTIVEYASVTCGACAAFHQQTYPTLKEKYIDTGKVRLILREFPTAPAPVAIAGFMLGRCSGDRFFPLVQTLFEQFNNWRTDPYNGFLRIAKQAGFTEQSFEACLKDTKLATGIQEVAQRANREFRVDSTPTFFINGRKYVGVLSVAELEKILEPLLGSG